MNERSVYYCCKGKVMIRDIRNGDRTKHYKKVKRGNVWRKLEDARDMTISS